MSENTLTERQQLESELKEILDQYLSESNKNHSGPTLAFAKHILEKTEGDICCYYEILEDHKIDPIIRFSAYYSLFCYHIHIRDMKSIIYLVDTYRPVSFQSEDVYVEYDPKHVKRFQSFGFAILSQYYIGKYENEHRAFYFWEAVKYAKQAVDMIDDSAGVFQNFADIVVTGIEEEIEGFDTKYFEDALVYINKAITLNENFALYYCTLGRLQIIQGDYSAAVKNIKKALSGEPRNRRNSYHRILMYQHFLEIAQLKLEGQQIKNDLNALELKLEAEQKKLNDQQFKNIEILSFFSAIMALLLTIPGFVSGMTSFPAAFGLILSMGGIVILCFLLLASFTDMLRSRPKKIYLNFLIPCIIGVILLLVGGYIGICKPI